MSESKKKTRKETIIDFTRRSKKKWQSINWRIFRCCYKNKKQQDENIQTMNVETSDVLEDEKCDDCNVIREDLDGSDKNQKFKSELIHDMTNTPPPSPENNNETNSSYVSDVAANWITIDK